MKYAHSLLLSSAFLATPALAQTINSDADPEASTTSIVVTGNRATDPVPIDQVGGSVTVLDQQVLDRRQVREVSDVLRDVPGVAVGRVPGQTQIRLRGAEANHTLVLVDGIEVSDPYAGEFDFGTLIADEASRIEVLRDDVGALLGEGLGEAAATRGDGMATAEPAAGTVRQEGLGNPGNPKPLWLIRRPARIGERPLFLASLIFFSRSPPSQ